MHIDLLKNLSDLAARRAISIREEAQLWDVLSRDLKREAKRQEELPARRITQTRQTEPGIEKPETDNRIFLRIPEAARMIGISRSSLYKEINAGSIKVKKLGKSTLISVQDIHEWMENLPEGLANFGRDAKT